MSLSKILKIAFWLVLIVGSGHVDAKIKNPADKKAPIQKGFIYQKSGGDFYFLAKKNSLRYHIPVRFANPSERAKTCIENAPAGGLEDCSLQSFSVKLTKKNGSLAFDQVRNITRGPFQERAALISTFGK